MNAAFIGAGFLAGTLATGLVLRLATRWRSFSLLPPALWVLATSLFAATMIHHDRFSSTTRRRGCGRFVYAVVPLAIPFLGRAPARHAEPPAAADPAARGRGVLSGIAGMPP